MAKKRKKARKAAAKRPVKKRKSASATAKSRTKKVRKSTARKSKTRKPAARKSKARKSKAKRAMRPKEGPIASAVHVVTDTILDAGALRSKLAGRDTFED